MNVVSLFGWNGPPQPLRRILTCGYEGLYFNRVSLFLLRSGCNVLAISPVCEWHSEPGFALHFGQRNRSGSRLFPNDNKSFYGVLGHGPGPREEALALS
jgi:hypothetical protein